jgi:hypothetical protein
MGETKVRDLRTLDRYRVSGKALWGWDGDGFCGAFLVPSPIDGGELVVIASSVEQCRREDQPLWDHLSVSRKNRCPNWQEMEHIVKMFGEDDETWMQLHVPASDHINIHPHVLHWWRPGEAEIPRPPGGHV